MNRLKLFIPLGIFVLLSGFLYYGLSLDPSKLPSALLSKPMPNFQLTTVAQADRWVSERDVQGEVALINVWATWCPACRIEHPQLMAIANQDRVPIYGVNYKDKRSKAQELLARDKDPYQFSVFDNKGSLGIDLGVYGAPETFIIDHQGMIRCKHVGIVSDKVWREKLKPVVEQLQAIAKGGPMNENQATEC